MLPCRIEKFILLSPGTFYVVYWTGLLWGGGVWHPHRKCGCGREGLFTWRYRLVHFWPSYICSSFCEDDRYVSAHSWRSWLGGRLSCESFLFKHWSAKIDLEFIPIFFGHQPILLCTSQSLLSLYRAVIGVLTSLRLSSVLGNPRGKHIPGCSVLTCYHQKCRLYAGKRWAQGFQEKLLIGSRKTPCLSLPKCMEKMSKVRSH